MQPFAHKKHQIGTNPCCETVDLSAALSIDLPCPPAPDDRFDARIHPGSASPLVGIDYSLIVPGTNNATGSSKGNDWKIARALAGATYAWPLTKKTGPALLVRLLGGSQQTISPDYKAELAYPASPQFGQL
jgi:hypothetical protein